MIAKSRKNNFIERRFKKFDAGCSDFDSYNKCLSALWLYVPYPTNVWHLFLLFTLNCLMHKTIELLVYYLRHFFYSRVSHTTFKFFSRERMKKDCKIYSATFFILKSSNIINRSLVSVVSLIAEYSSNKCIVFWLLQKL